MDIAAAKTQPMSLTGYVRVQIPPRDYPAAVDLLTAGEFEGELGAAPNGGPIPPPGNSGLAGGPPSVS